MSGEDPVTEARVELITQFARTGSLPFWADPANPQVVDGALAALQTQSKGLSRLCEVIVRDLATLPGALERLARHVSASRLRRLLETLTPTSREIATERVALVWELIAVAQEIWTAMPTSVIWAEALRISAVGESRQEGIIVFSREVVARIALTSGTGASYPTLLDELWAKLKPANAPNEAKGLAAVVIALRQEMGIKEARPITDDSVPSSTDGAVTLPRVNEGTPFVDSAFPKEGAPSTGKSTSPQNADAFAAAAITFLNDKDAFSGVAGVPSSLRKAFVAGADVPESLRKALLSAADIPETLRDASPSNADVAQTSPGASSGAGESSLHVDGAVRGRLQWPLRNPAGSIHTSKTLPSFPAARRSPSENENPGEIQLTTAGLILLWPFIATFFDRVGLLAPQESGKAQRFLDHASRCRGVLLLHHVATGKVAPPEYRLPLEKILCGLHLNEPFHSDVAFTELQLVEADELLSAVITHAQNLGDITVQVFRAAFLCRRGVLSMQGDTWLLRVEKDPFDVVLAGLPWTISWIRLPFMETAIAVEWSV